MYDGEDLAGVAEHWRRDRPRGGRPAAPDRVPGGVLRLRARVRVPDRAAGASGRCPGWPRPGPGCRPARSALAGPYAGIYPTASPGGWRLVGRTDADPVRRARRPARPARPRHPGPAGGGMIEVRPGAGRCTTVQDLGRPGLGAPRRTPVGGARPGGAGAGQPARRQPGGRRRAGDHPRPAARCGSPAPATVAVTGRGRRRAGRPPVR